MLEVDGLTVTLQTRRGALEALRDVSFAVGRGETLGVIGESGSGKTLTALAVIGLLPEAARVGGHVRLHGEDLAGAPEARLCRIRGKAIGMVFQEPMTALNPLQTVARQVAEPLSLHQGLARRDARAAAVQLLDRVGLPDVPRKAGAYPHQLSGGQRQRVMIAMAIACGPDLLIADEPTTALDATTQSQILDLVAGLVAERGMALMLISHDLDVIADNVGRTLVLYAGIVVESGPTQAVFARLAHPYTRALFAARPRLGVGRGRPLPTIPGSVPEIGLRPAGCPFADRCPLAVDACRAALPALLPVGPGHAARCIRLDAATMLPVQP